MKVVYECCIFYLNFSKNKFESVFINAEKGNFVAIVLVMFEAYLRKFSILTFLIEKTITLLRAVLFSFSIKTFCLKIGVNQIKFKQVTMVRSRFFLSYSKPMLKTFEVFENFCCLGTVFGTDLLSSKLFLSLCQKFWEIIFVTLHTAS